MAQILVSGGAQILSGAARYSSLSGAYNTDTGTWATAESLCSQVITTPGSLTELNIELSVAPGAGKSYAFVVMLNGSPTTLTTTISDANVSGSDMAHSVALVAGDVVSIRCTPTGTTATSIPQFSTKFTSTNPNEFLVLGHGYQFNNTANSFLSVDAGGHNNFFGSSNEVTAKQVFPTATTFNNLYIKLSTAPGTGASWTFFVRKNGVNTGITVVISGASTTGNDTTHSQAFAAGDTITLIATPSSPTLPALSDVSLGLMQTPTTTGEFIMMTGSASPLTTTTPCYTYLQTYSQNSSWADAPAKRNQLGGAFTAQKLFVLLSGVPGVGKSYTITLMKNGVATALTCTVSGGSATTASDIIDTVPIADGDNICFQSVASGTPTSRIIACSIVGVSSVAGDKTVEVSAQPLTLLQKSPTVTFSCNVYPSAQALTLIQKVVTVNYDKQVSVNTQSLSLVQLEPFAQTGSSIGVNVSSQDLLLTIKDPTVVIASGGVGDENTYFICDTGVGNVDTLKKYVDGVLVEADTATTKTVYTNVVFANNGFGKIISLTNTGDNKTYTMSQAATTSEYLILMNNGLYSTDDNQFPFSISGTTLTFVAILPTDMASTKIKLICV